MSDQLICSYCGKPIDDENDVAYPFVGSDSPTHSECAENASLEEVADVHNTKGSEGLEDFDKQSDIQSMLDNTKRLNELSQLDADWER